MLAVYRFHDLHHSLGYQNYGIIGVLDRFHGTYYEAELPSEGNDEPRLDKQGALKGEPLVVCHPKLEE